MQEILNKLNEANLELNKKIAETSSLKQELYGLVASNKSVKEELNVREADIKVLEKKFAEYSSVEELRAKLNADRGILFAEKAELKSKAECLALDIEKFKKDRADLDVLISIYKKKSVDVDNMKASLEEEKKNLEKKIVEQFTKSLTGK